MKYNNIKNNIKIIFSGIAIFLVITIIVYGVFELNILPDNGNDWAGYCGSFIGTIIGAYVAIHVLVETIKDNRKSQVREEVINFCNLLVEKCALFAQNYESTIYEAHTYLASYEQHEVTFSEQQLTEYRHFLSKHHSAKTVLYEIENYLEIRKNIDDFYTPNFEETLQMTTKTYNAFKNYEKTVGKAKNLEDIDDKKLIDTVEKFLEMMSLYEKELLARTIKERKKQMKTVKEIYDEVEKCADEHHREEIATCYLRKLTEEIGDSKAKLLIYKKECQERTDLNVPSYMMASLATMLAILSVLVTMLGLKPSSIGGITLTEVGLALCIILIVILIAYYTALRERKKFALMSLALEQIEIELNKD